MIPFPQIPNLNQVFTVSGSSWIWNGQSWSYVENNPELKKLAFYDSLSTDDIVGLRAELNGHTHTASQISNSTPAGRLLLTGANAASQRNFLGLGDILNSALYITGNQSVNGVKNFLLRPTINGTGVLLSGEVAKLPTTLLYSTGDQNISGIFTSYLNNGEVKIDLGLSNYVQVVNRELFDIRKGQVVRLIADGSDLIASVKLASCTGQATSSNTIGILSHNLVPGQTGYAINRGLITGISLDLFNDGDEIYLGTSIGEITNQKQYYPNHLIRLGFVEKAGTGSSQGSAYIKIQDDYQLDDLHDVITFGAVSGSLLGNNGLSWSSMSPLDLKLIKNHNGCSSVRVLTQVEYDGLASPEPYADTLYIISDVVGTQFTGVLSVAGKQGIVTLNTSDVNGLGTAATLPSGFFYPASNPNGYITGNLSNYSLTGHTHAASQISDASAAGRLLLTGADATSQRASLGLGTIATLASGLFYPASNPSDYITNANIVNTTGNQLIGGIKDFSIRPTVNGTGILLSGEAVNSTVISGIFYSAQINIKNNNGSTIYKGQPVYVSGAAGNNILVALASNSTEPTSSKTLGLVAQDSLLQNAFGTIITEGFLKNVDTSLAGGEGDPIWLGPTGSLIYGLSAKPEAPNHLVYLGVVTRKHTTNGEIFVKIQNGFELDELHNVNVSASVSGDFLFNDGDVWRGITPNISNISGLSSELSSKVMNLNGCSSIRTLTQIEYDGLSSPEPYPDTLYIISDINGYPAQSYKNTPVISNGQLGLNLANSNFFYVNLNQNITGFNLNSSITSGAVASFDLQVESDGNGRTITWFPGVKWSNSTPPTLTANAGKVDTFSFMTHDAGQRWFASIKGQNQ